MICRSVIACIAPRVSVAATAAPSCRALHYYSGQHIIQDHTPAATVEFIDVASIDALLRRPLDSDPWEQLAQMEEDDQQRGQRSFAVPENCCEPGRAFTWSSWGNYFMQREGWEDDVRTDRLLLQALTGAYSCVLTMAAAIDRIGARDPSRELLVHVIGAAASHEEALLPYYWPELALLLPAQPMSIALVGPDLSGRYAVPLDDTVRATTHDTDYLTFRRGESSFDNEHRTPDIVVGFQPGLGTDQEMWAPTLKVLLDEGVPTVFTAFDGADQSADVAFLKDQAGARFLWGAEENPWGSSMPEQRTRMQGEEDSDNNEGEHEPRIGYANLRWHAVRGRL